MRILFILSAVAVLFLIGQWYLHSRRRKARALFVLLAQHTGYSRQGGRMELVAGGRRVVLDAQVSDEKRPEELRLTVKTGLHGDFRLALPAALSYYGDCRHREPAAEGAPFAGWYVGSEDQGLLQAISAEQRFREALEALAGLGFTRIEHKNARLRALWPDFPWSPEKHVWDTKEAEALPNRVSRAAGRLSDLVTATEAALQALGRKPHGKRVQAALTALLLFPLLFMIAGILAAILHLYQAYPTLRDEELLVAMLVASTALSAFYSAGAYVLLRNSGQRGARAALVGILALFAFFPGSTAPILWWNGTGPQGPAQRVTVEVVALELHSPLASGRGRLVRMLVGDNSRLEEWLTTYRAMVRSWREPPSIYAITLAGEQFRALPPRGGRLSLSVFPGALGLEWYSDVAVELVTGAGPQ